MREALDSTGRDKISTYAGLDALKKEVVESYPEDNAEKRAMAGKVFGILKEKIFREDIFGNRRRPDGRKFSEIRPITCEVGWLPRVHGSSLFTRGETQAIVTTTLGTKMDEQFMDDLETGEVRRNFMLHYNFPPYSVGETGRFGGSSRREIGHGNLARRALQAILPDDGVFPYTLRSRFRNHRIKRFEFDGDGLRRLSEFDGRRRSDQEAGCRCGDGFGDGRQSLRDFVGHCRCRRSLR